MKVILCPEYIFKDLTIMAKDNPNPDLDGLLADPDGVWKFDGEFNYYQLMVMIIRQAYKAFSEDFDIGCPRCMEYGMAPGYKCPGCGYNWDEKP